MTQFKPLSETFSVAPQITIDDVKTAAQQGIVSIICNRPDGEEPGQIALSDIVAACKANNIAFFHIPIAGGIPAQAVSDMAAAIEASEGPILAYCRSGTRSTHLWAMAQATQGAAIDELVQAAAAAGYDLRGLVPALQSVSSR